MVDRFDICEAYWVLACDYGLYGIITRLEGMGYRPGLSARNGVLSTDEMRDIYHANMNRAMLTDPYARRLATA